MCVVCLGVCVACDVDSLVPPPTIVCAKAGSGARGTRRHSLILWHSSTKLSPLPTPNQLPRLAKVIILRIP